MRSEDEPILEKPDPFAHWGYGAGDPAAQPPEEMAAASARDEPAVRRRASKRVLVALVGVGTLAALALVLAVGQGGGSAAFVPTRVSQAAYVTTREPGYK